MIDKACDLDMESAISLYGQWQLRDLLVLEMLRLQLAASTACLANNKLNGLYLDTWWLWSFACIACLKPVHGAVSAKADPITRS